MRWICLTVFVVAGACNFSVTGLPISSEEAPDAAMGSFDPHDPGGVTSGGGADLATTDAVQPGLSVDVSCSDKSTCKVDCAAAASCKVDCSGGSHCTCTGAGCTFTSCKPMTCKNGVQVCGTPCP